MNRGTKSLVGLLASRDFLAGVAFTVIGAAYAFGSLATLKVGQASNMGPGYFPLLLSGALVVVGLLVLLRSLRQEIVRVGPVNWRAIVLVSLVPLVFALTLPGLGMLPAVFLSTVVGILANRDAKLLPGLLTAAAITAVCVALFIWALGLPARPIGPWLGG